MYRPKFVCYCPFYEGEYRKAICCSGVEKSTKTVRYFPSEEMKIKYVKGHCTHKCPDCPLYNILKDYF